MTDSVTVTCNDGYLSSGASSFVITCLDDVTGRDVEWNGVSSCESVTCTDLTVENTQGTTAVAGVYGTSHTVVCNSGYTSSAGTSYVATCTGAGLWDNTFLCEPVACDPDLSVTNSDTNEYSGVTGGSKTVRCDDGFVSGSGTTFVAQCTASGAGTATWTDVQTCDAVDCSDLTIENSGASGAMGVTGTTVLVTCDTGYSSTSGPTFTTTCSPDGPGAADWTNKLVCDALPCDPLNVADSGTSAGTGNTGQTIQVDCNQGFSSSAGDSFTATCLSDGTWNALTCEQNNECIDVAGFVLSCSSGDADSAWNFVKTSTTSWTSTSAFNPIDSSTAPPPPTTPTPPTTNSLECADVAGWVNTFGDDCTWFDASSEGSFYNCESSGSTGEQFGLVANEACCSCGGGVYGTQPALVECAFTVDNLIEGFYVNGVDLYTFSPASADDWSITKTWSFYDFDPVGSYTVAIKAREYNLETDACVNHEECAGFIWGCRSSDPASPWNYMKSDKHSWTTYSSSTADLDSSDWYGSLFDDSNWLPPLDSVSVFDCNDCTNFRPDAIPIWGNEYARIGFGGEYSYFRSAICPLAVPDFDGYIVGSPVLRVFGSPVATTCAQGYEQVGEITPVTCDANGEWADPSGCVSLAEVTCVFTSKDVGLGLFLGDLDVTGDVTGILTDSEVTKSFSFFPTGGPQVLGFSGNATCDTVNPTVGSLDGPGGDWFSGEYDVTTWNSPAVATSTLNCASCDVGAANIWGVSSDGASLPNAWFRTAVCSSTDVGHDGFVFADGLTTQSISGSVRAVECDQYHTGAGDTLTCLSDGTWSVPANPCTAAIVTCEIGADDFVIEVYMDDMRLETDGSSVSFPENAVAGSQRFGVRIQSLETCGLGGCASTGGLLISCSSTDVDSSWNFISSSTESFISTSTSSIASAATDAVAKDWYTASFDLSSWGAPLTSSSGVTCPNCAGTPEPIWGDQDKQFAYFRTGTCDDIPAGNSVADGYVAIDGDFRCDDVAGWNAFGDTCAYYEASDYFTGTGCVDFGSDASVDGLSADDACCFCGGGEKVVDPSLNTYRHVGYERGLECAEGYWGEPTPTVCQPDLTWSTPAGCTFGTPPAEPGAKRSISEPSDYTTFDVSLISALPSLFTFMIIFLSL
jgi:hypothetical protein